MTRVAAGARVGVVGAGTMGAGIAEVAARAGHPVRLLDVAPGAGAAAVADLRSRLGRDVEKGRLDRAGADDVLARVVVVDDVAGLAGCALVVEAVAERLDVKRELFAALEAVLDTDALLATNTSSLSVTAVAAGLRRPGRVVGLHFFNPAPRMRLVEVVRGDDTDHGVVEAATELARAWGKTPVTCTSTPGFIVNRVARPFYGEAQRMVEEGVADPATIDLVLRECGGFPMGPFELTDLVGQDVNLAVSKSVWEQTFGDPRYAPTVFQQRLVDAGRLGRKAGRGVYDYGEGADGARTVVTSEPPRPAPDRVEQPSFTDWGFMQPFIDRVAAGGVDIVVAEGNAESVLPGIALPGNGVLVLTDGSRSTSYTTWDAREGPRLDGVVSLDWMGDPSEGNRVALAPSRGCAQLVLDSAIGFCQAGGVEVTLVKDGPGIVVARTLSMLINEAADLLERCEASAADIDTAMVQGTGYPRGPLGWAHLIGADRLRDVIDQLHHEVPSGRYRVSRLLEDAATLGGDPRDLDALRSERRA